MPNIILVGFETDTGKHGCQIRYAIQRIDILQLFTKIEQAMKSIGLEDDAVLTNVRGSYVISLDGNRKHMPYIRICSTGGMDEIMRIVEAFKVHRIYYDIEMVVLPTNGFIEAKDMKT